MSHKKYTPLGLMGALLMLSGCADYALYEFDHMKLQGTDFDKTLARGYAEFASLENDKPGDEMDAFHFADKALQAGQGNRVMPENPADWNIPPSERPALTRSYQRLLKALEKGARNDVPIPAAEAQIYHDCWVEEAEESWNRNYIRFCRDGFMEKIGIVESLMSQEKFPAFVVLFGIDSAVIDAEGMKIIDKAVHASKTQKGFRVHVLGRTDRIGKQGYNQSLSVRRAQAVEHALRARGVPVSKGNTKGLGETSGQYVEPDNRRVDILWVK